ncbi:MAG: D-lyxose/D-mannose family sugar isomerase [Clostridia bacterium]|nr:D-lyxose/D-mannose family sugar isomerase [Clostridia bacterium]
MKKCSKINDLITEAKDFIEKINFKLPPFAYWTPRNWVGKGSEYDEN